MCLFTPPLHQICGDLAEFPKPNLDRWLLKLCFLLRLLLSFASLVSLSYILHLHSYFRHFAGALIWNNLEKKIKTERNKKPRQIVVKLLHISTFWPPGLQDSFHHQRHKNRHEYDFRICLPGLFFLRNSGWDCGSHGVLQQWAESIQLTVNFLATLQ